MINSVAPAGSLEFARAVALLFVAGAVLGAEVTGVSGQSYAGISGTPHDFSASRPLGDSNIAEGESGATCVVCHTPGRGPTEDDPSPTGFATYEVSSGIELGAADPGSVSQLCVSCHDGASASSKFFGSTTSHPFAIDYDEFSPGDLRPAASVARDGLKLFPNAGRPRVECASCHDPHDNRYGNFLRMTNARSRLCFTCHDK